MDGDGEISGNLGQAYADVATSAEPQLAAMDQTGGEGLADEQSG